MKMRTFTFTPDHDGRSDFRLMYEAFRIRDPAKCVKDERQYIAQWQRALDSVSDPIGDLPDDAEVDGRLRKLSAEGGTITLTQRLHEKIVGYLEETPFQAVVSVACEDLRDRWDQAQKSDSDETKLTLAKGSQA